MALTNFVSVDLSAFYCDITKDILYCEKKDSLRRRQVQSVIFLVVDRLMRLFNPILPFTMDEVFHTVYPDAKGSPQLLDFPKTHHVFSEDLLNEYAAVLKVRSDVLKSLEVARSSGLIGSAQEASVTLHVHGPLARKALQSLDQAELARYFIVSHVHLVDTKVGDSYESSDVLVERHQGQRCDRCWNYFDDLHEVEGNHICKRCLDAVGE